VVDYAADFDLGQAVSTACCYAKAAPYYFGDVESIQEAKDFFLGKSVIISRPSVVAVDCSLAVVVMLEQGPVQPA